MKDVGRILGIDHNYINNLNKELPSHNGKVMDLADAVEEIDSFRKARELHPELFELALDLQSMPRGASVHSCGIQCAPVPLNSNIPLMRSKEGSAVTQYEGPILENLGYVKFDILGLKNLSVLRIACELIDQRHRVLIDINNIEPEDEKVFEMIRQGNTQGVFQLEF